MFFHLTLQLYTQANTYLNFLNIVAYIGLYILIILHIGLLLFSGPIVVITILLFWVKCMVQAYMKFKILKNLSLQYIMTLSFYRIGIENARMKIHTLPIKVILSSAATSWVSGVFVVKFGHPQELPFWKVCSVPTTLKLI